MIIGAGLRQKAAKLAIERPDGAGAYFVDGCEEPAKHIMVVRGGELASISNYARRRDVYVAAAGFDA